MKGEDPAPYEILPLAHPAVTAADYLIQFTPEEMRELEKLFPAAGSKCLQFEDHYYGFVDTGRKRFIPLKRPTYV